MITSLLQRRKLIDKIASTYGRKALPQSSTIRPVIVSKKTRMPYGSLTTQGNPTQHAINAYLVYLTNIVDTEKKLCPYALQKVRDYFNMDRGFNNYLRTGMSLTYARHNNNGMVYQAMSKAYMEARGMIGKGVILAEMSLN